MATPMGNGPEPTTATAVPAPKASSHRYVRTGSGEWTCASCRGKTTEPGQLLAKTCPA